MSSSGTRSSRSPHAATHQKKPSLSSFAGLAGRPSLQSISSSMPWLSRSSTSVSEPKSSHKTSRSIEVVSPRSGTLGSGATVVRTPNEALQDSHVRLQYDSSPPPPSRALPALPPLADLESDDEGERVEEYRVPSGSQENIRVAPPRPTRSIPARPDIATPPPPFHVLLISDPPNSNVDRSKVIVTLETCTQTFRTTLDTLLSQPSLLAEYLLSLFPRPRSSSLYSTGSEGEHDMQDMYRNHLISQGLLSKTPFNLHLFLDRPSASYHSIISYLRTGAFPRVSSLEELLDLRDEAAYLDLPSLHALCAEEVRQQTGISAAPLVHSMHASVHSLHDLIERVGNESQATQDSQEERVGRPLHAKTSSEAGSATSSGGFRSPPTPQSWKNGRSSSTSHHGHARGASTMSVRQIPAGWI